MPILQWNVEWNYSLIQTYYSGYFTIVGFFLLVRQHATTLCYPDHNNLYIIPKTNNIFRYFVLKILPRVDHRVEYSTTFVHKFDSTLDKKIHFYKLIYYISVFYFHNSICISVCKLVFIIWKGLKLSIIYTYFLRINP